MERKLIYLVLLLIGLITCTPPEIPVPVITSIDPDMGAVGQLVRLRGNSLEFASTIVLTP